VTTFVTEHATNYEFAKLRALRTQRARVPYVPACFN